VCRWVSTNLQILPDTRRAKPCNDSRETETGNYGLLRVNPLVRTRCNKTLCFFPPFPVSSPANCLALEVIPSPIHSIQSICSTPAYNPARASCTRARRNIDTQIPSKPPATPSPHVSSTCPMDKGWGIIFSVAYGCSFPSPSIGVILCACLWRHFNHEILACMLGKARGVEQLVSVSKGMSREH
jgi:hypothetical protein